MEDPCTTGDLIRVTNRANEVYRERLEALGRGREGHREIESQQVWAMMIAIMECQQAVTDRLGERLEALEARAISYIDSSEG